MTNIDTFDLQIALRDWRILKARTTKDSSPSHLSCVSYARQNLQLQFVKLLNFDTDAKDLAFSSLGAELISAMFPDVNVPETL